MEIKFNDKEIDRAAAEFLRFAKPYKVFAFSGELGAGKTTFINALCGQLKVEEPVTSPTYSIIQEYHSTEGPLYHLDLYRLGSTREALDAGVEDYLNSGYICMVEWPEKASDIFPPQTLFCTIEITGNTNRRLSADLPE